MARNSQDYDFYGCRLRSSLPLTLVAGCATEQAEADVTLRCGAVPASLAETIWSSPFVSIGADGTALIHLEAIGGMLVRGGREIVVDALPHVAPLEIETMLMGAVAGVLLHQRCELPLHGSCVEVDGSAVAFCGPCGRGKSTLARAFVQRGAALLSDDVSVVRFGEDGKPSVLPGSRGIRLWPDSRESLQKPDEVWSPIRSGHLKRVTAYQPTASGACPLKAIIRLAGAGSSRSGLGRLQGPAALMPMSETVYRAKLGREIGRGEMIFRAVMRLASTTPVYELRHAEGLDRLDETVGWIRDALESLN